MNRNLLLALFFVGVNVAAAVSHDEIIKRIRRADLSAIGEAHDLYKRMTNASDRQELRAAMQTSLDVDPSVLLGIPGINVENFCDGADIAMIVSDAAVIKRVDRRTKRINASTISQDIKQRCIKSLSRLKSCTVKKDC